MFGAGCWVERSAGGRRVACSVSGQGELIVQSSLARTLAERAAADTANDTHEILRSVLVDDFYGASAIFLSSIHDAGFTSKCNACACCVVLR
jgi:isoaspartyl peptidase/L-asparaginase-like protein (Ntn-hydrolase superfamily)